MAFTARTETYVRGSSLSSPYSFTINTAGGVQNGDIMFMYLMVYVSSPPTIDAAPDGWTEVATNTAGNSRWFLYYKIASSEGANYTWSLTKSCRYYALNIAYSSGDFDVTGLSGITAISNTLYGTAGQTVRAASMNVPDANSPLVYFASIYNTTARTFTKPTTPVDIWVEDADQGHGTPDISITNGSMIWTGYGSTGDIDIVCSASITTNKHAFAIALKPAVAPTPSPTQTPTLSISSTPSLSISSTPSLSISQTPSLSISATPSLSISATQTPSISPTTTPSLSISSTPSLSISATRTPSLSVSSSPGVASPSPTPSLSISSTPSLSISATPSLSISATRTPSITPSRTPSLSISATRTPSITPTRTPSISISPTRTPSLSPSPSFGAVYSNWVVKYSTTTVPNTIKNKNMVFGSHGDAEWGPTSITGFWNGADPPTGGYTIYYLTALRQEPIIYVANTDDKCIFLAKQFGGTNINTISDAITYFSVTNPDTNIFNNSGIIT